MEYPLVRSCVFKCLSVCVYVCISICPCKCVLFSVGGQNICLLAASFPKVLSNRDKWIAYGKIDRRMWCLFRWVHRLQPKHHIKGKKDLEERRGIFQWRVMIKSTKRSEGKRKSRGGGLLGGEGYTGESHNGDSNGERWRLNTLPRGLLYC